MTQTENIKMVVTHDRQKRQPITAVPVAQPSQKYKRSIFSA